MSTPCCQISTPNRLVVSEYEVPKVLRPFSEDSDRPEGQEWNVGGPKPKTGL